MYKLIQFFRRHCSFLWNIIAFVNQSIVNLLYNDRLNKAIIKELPYMNQIQNYYYRVLDSTSIPQLLNMLNEQPTGFNVFFKPHDFDYETFRKLLDNKSYSLMGAYDGEKIIGYFFIRFFLNRSAYIGYMVDSKYQGKGIAKQMITIMTNICFNANFKVYASISKHNLKSLYASKASTEIKVLEELNDDYLRIEYFPKMK